MTNLEYVAGGFLGMAWLMAMFVVVMDQKYYRDKDNLLTALTHKREGWLWILFACGMLAWVISGNNGAAHPVSGWGWVPGAIVVSIIPIVYAVRAFRRAHTLSAGLLL